MKPLSEWKEIDIEMVVTAQVQENSSVEYKSSEALNFDDTKAIDKGKLTLGASHRDELIRDVTAMANAEGGNIYYGIAERDGGFPKKVDDGYDASKTNAERIEQILLNNIHPRCDDFKIYPIELESKGKGQFGYIIGVTKATKNAPYQAADKLYYKRHERTRMTMSDSEIRDAMRRSIDYGRQFGAAWDLNVEVARLASAIKERIKLDNGDYVARNRLIISVHQGLRSAGNAMILLPKELRADAAALVASIDAFNSIIEMTDPGRREEARLNAERKDDLAKMLTLANSISSAAGKVLEGEP